MIIIDSSNYISELFLYDFGQLPDAFLPIGNNRLIDVIIKRLYKKNENIFLIIPNNFNLDKILNYQLSDLGINYIYKDQFKDLSNHIFQNNLEKYENIKYIHRLALPIEDMSGFEKYKKFSSDIPSFGLCINYNFNFEQIFSSKKIDSLDKFNKEIYQLKLFKTKNTSKLNTIDLGISTHYFKVRAELVSLRFFNKLKIENNKISKTVQYSKKGEEEANWYKNTKKYIPQIAPSIINSSKDKKTYTLEYLPMVSLSEIYTYGQIDINYWDNIFSSISYILGDMHKCAVNLIKKNRLKIIDEDLNRYDEELFKVKTINRLCDFCRSKNINYPFDVSLNKNKKVNVEEIIYMIFKYINKIKKKYLYIHGDFCLSNILYDSRLSTIKLVDPKGHKNENNLYEMIKFQTYDLTKLAHSLLGFYDLINTGEIMAESYSINKDFIEIKCNYSVDFYHEMIYKKASSYEFLDNCKLNDFLPSTVLLFLSMLPMHSDNELKQITLLGNAIRIFESINSI